MKKKRSATLRLWLCRLNGRSVNVLARDTVDVAAKLSRLTAGLSSVSLEAFDAVRVTSSPGVLRRKRQEFARRRRVKHKRT